MVPPLRAQFGQPTRPKSRTLCHKRCQRGTKYRTLCFKRRRRDSKSRTFSAKRCRGLEPSAPNAVDKRKSVVLAGVQIYCRSFHENALFERFFGSVMVPTLRTRFGQPSRPKSRTLSPERRRRDPRSRTLCPKLCQIDPRSRTLCLKRQPTHLRSRTLGSKRPREAKIRGFGKRSNLLYFMKMLFSNLFSAR